MLAILKYLSIVLTTGLGVLGLLANFRDKETSRVTRSGRWLLLGIIASGAIVIATQALEDLRQHAEREDNIEHMARGEYPLRNVRLSCWATLPSKEYPQLLAYHRRLAANAAEARERLRTGLDVPGTSFWGGAPGKPPVGISVRPNSPYYPHPETEPFASLVIKSFRVVLQFYRTPISKTQHPLLGANAGVHRTIFPDLEMTFFANSTVGIEHFFYNDSLVLSASELSADSRLGSHSGRIVSLVTLRRAQMFIELQPLPAMADHDARVAPELSQLKIHVDNLDAFWIDVERMTQHAGPNGYVVYEYRFPDTVDAILALTGKS